MGSSDKDAQVAHCKLVKELDKQKFTWADDLPAILAVDCRYMDAAMHQTLGLRSSEGGEIKPAKLSKKGRVTRRRV
jgi:hypothetical protein